MSKGHSAPAGPEARAKGGNALAGKAVAPGVGGGGDRVRRLAAWLPPASPSRLPLPAPLLACAPSSPSLTCSRGFRMRQIALGRRGSRDLWGWQENVPPRRGRGPSELTRRPSW